MICGDKMTLTDKDKVLDYIQRIYATAETNFKKLLENYDEKNPNDYIANCWHFKGIMRRACNSLYYMIATTSDPDFSAVIKDLLLFIEDEHAGASKEIISYIKSKYDVNLMEFVK